MSVTPVGFLSVSKDGKTEFISVEGKTAVDPVEQACDLLDRSPEIIQKIKNIFDSNVSKPAEVVVEEIIK